MDTLIISDEDESDGSETSSNADLSDANDSDHSAEEAEADDNEVTEEKDDFDDYLENDPFLARVEPEIPEELQAKITEKTYSKQCVTWPNLGNVIVQCPKWTPEKSIKPKCLLDDDDEDDESGNSSQQIKLKEFQEKLVNVPVAEPLKDYFLTDQLSNNLAAANVSNLSGSKLLQPLTGLQSELLCHPP